MMAFILMAVPGSVVLPQDLRYEKNCLKEDYTGIQTINLVGVPVFCLLRRVTILSYLLPCLLRQNQVRKRMENHRNGNFCEE